MAIKTRAIIPPIGIYRFIEVPMSKFQSLSHKYEKFSLSSTHIFIIRSLFSINRYSERRKRAPGSTGLSDSFPSYCSNSPDTKTGIGNSVFGRFYADDKKVTARRNINTFTKTNERLNFDIIYLGQIDHFFNLK